MRRRPDTHRFRRHAVNHRTGLVLRDSDGALFLQKQHFFRAIPAHAGKEHPCGVFAADIRDGTEERGDRGTKAIDGEVRAEIEPGSGPQQHMKPVRRDIDITGKDLLILGGDMNRQPASKGKPFRKTRNEARRHMLDDEDR